jgi:Tfp pilus assembly protein PilX
MTLINNLEGTEMKKSILTRLNKDERGQALVLVLILMLLGGLIVTPLLSHMGTGLKVGQVFENKADELYAADSGIEDGLWQVKNDQLPTKFATYDPTYAPYDYYTTSWTYPLGETMNDKNVNVNIQNIWMPKDLAAPDKTNAKQIIEGSIGQVPKLIVTSVASLPSSYKINIDYYPTVGETLNVITLGVWLPPGFTYVAGSSNLEANPANPYYSVPVTSTWRSGQAVVWSFSSVPFTSFPGVNPLDSPMGSTITFQFRAAQSGQTPAAVSWINTSLNLSGGYTYTWDADKKVYQITSTTGNTTVDAYAIKVELRKLGSAISGDYRAAGNSLMRDTIPDSYGVRDMLDSQSNSVVSNIPQDAQVAAAYLYWSAWRDESAKQSVFSDTCSSSNLSNYWTAGSSWSYYSSGGYYRSHYSSGGESARYLPLKNSLNLSSYVPGAVMVSWQQAEDGTLESDDALLFSFSGDGGVNWSGNYEAFRDDIGSSWVNYTCVIPSQYLTASFKIRFYIADFGDSNDGYCRLDNIKIIVMPPDTSVVFKIDGQQVYFDANGDPQQGSGALTVSKSQVLPNYNSDGSSNGFSYAGYKDVTKLVQTYSAKAPDPATNHPGNGTYTLGGVTGVTGNQWSYAGWSLVIIYQSPDTKGHQLYLYDTFIYAHNNTDIDFDKDGQPGGTISGFLVPQPVTGEVNAATLTAFVGEGDQVWTGDYLKFNLTALSDGFSTNNVWNGRSLGMTADGVDIDTFYITWASNLLQPGDTSALIDLPTQDDSWNLVYIILSFRSETTTGGTITYLIR